MKTKFIYDKKSYNLNISNRYVFSPTATTKFLIDAILKYKIKNKKILDLGCGSGIISIVLSKYSKKLYASDLLNQITKCATINFKKNKLKIITRYGNGLEPWEGCKFDIIACDIAGISSKISNISPWYKGGVPCNTGDDGTRLIINVINNAKKKLHQNGKIFLAIISLSNEKKILKMMRKNFEYIKLIFNNEWQMPIEMHNSYDLLNKLKKKRKINFTEKFGSLFCNTKIYMCKN
jgi:tRNA1(Val) A37 N6-methylase TrmN6